MHAQITHHFLDDCEFARICASARRGVTSNQLVKPLAIENVQMVQSTMANTKLKGWRT
jgi:hypothetical protein